MSDIRQLRGPIVVFGAGGFIGANLYRRLLAERSDCYAVTHQRHTPWRLNGTPADRLLQCDVTDRYSVQRLFDTYRFQSIFFLSAYGAYSRQSEVSRIYDTNVTGLVNVIQVAQSEGFDALVHAGSSSEYGTNSAGPKEEDPKRPNSHYAVSKLATSQLIQYLGEQQGLPVIHLRYYSIYGPWEESDRLVPRLVESALLGKLPRLVDPQISRDFVYVDDAVDATVSAAVRGVKIAPGACLNIASGKKTTLADLVEISRNVFSVEELPQWGTMPNRNWDLKDWYGRPERAKEILQWSAKTELSTGLQATANWIKGFGSTPIIRETVDSERPVRLSAVVACYRDAEAIPLMHQRLTKVFRKLRVDYEIIFVNDCSPDRTSQVLEKLCAEDDHVVAIEHSRNFGSQSAFASGMEISTGHAVILLDGDLQDPPELIAEFFEKWREGYEVVYGRRVRREASLLLQACYKSFYRVFRLMADIPIPLDAGDFSLLDAKVVRHLGTLPETDQFLRGLRAWVGFKQTGVDYVRPDRMFGRSTNNWRKNFWWARKAIFSFSFVPLELLLYGGFGLTFLAFLGLIGQTVYRLYHPEMPHGISTIIILILLFGGGNLLAISILGEYVGKVLEETKRRPKFIRRAVRSGKFSYAKDEEIQGFVRSRRKNANALGLLGEPQWNT
jgi:polyisoprenyl-phosphate glycosyltransferase